MRDAWVAAGGALVVGGLAALIFVIRAGGDPELAATWPIGWELRSSDNGTLFQLMQDVVAGRALDWSFSPQVYVFPEIPISAAAFALAVGDLYRYYAIVAAVNAALMYLAILALTRVLRRDESIAIGTIRALIAMLPLLILPLVGSTWILSFHLAPTYYVGMYLALIAAPVLLLARSAVARLAIGSALSLAIASNPLTLVFAAPGVVIVLVLGTLRAGWRAAVRPSVWAGGVVVAAGLLRIGFTPLQGTSPLTYVDLEVFRSRLATIGPYFAFQARDPAAAIVLTFGLVLAMVCLGAAVAAAISLARQRREPHADSSRERLLAVAFLGVVPLGGLAATFAALITHYYYFWPVVILPFALVLLAVPRVAIPTALATGGAILLAVGLASGGLTNVTGGVYVGYRSAETRCIDDALPPGVQVGYATFSDARRLSLTSITPFRLIQVGSTAQPNHWLTNRAYARSETGQFFYLNPDGDERPIDPAVLTQQFGPPDHRVSCLGRQEIWIYTDPQKITRISGFYAADH